MNHQRLKQLLSQMSELLCKCQRPEWADRLDECNAKLDADAQAAVSDLRALYGGVGSINDIVLYRDMQPLILENQAFDALREELFSSLR
jgi:hypothetical protein